MRTKFNYFIINKELRTANKFFPEVDRREGVHTEGKKVLTIYSFSSVLSKYFDVRVNAVSIYLNSLIVPINMI